MSREQHIGSCGMKTTPTISTASAAIRSIALPKTIKDGRGSVHFRMGRNYCLSKEERLVLKMFIIRLIITLNEHLMSYGMPTKDQIKKYGWVPPTESCALTRIKIPTK